MTLKVEKWSPGYAVLKPSFKLFFKYWFRRVEIIGKENIPENHAVIFAPNHQNALMDALAVCFHVKGQPVFVARADIFSKGFTSWFLNFLKILPIYRIRDGFESLQKNDEIFEKTIAVLKRKKKLVVMPEGNHDGKRMLRPLKKGLARIAVQALEEVDEIFIVPVCLDYESYTDFRSSLLVRFAKPIRVSEFKDQIDQDVVSALKTINEQIKQSLTEMMLDIRLGEDYDEGFQLIDFLCSNSVRNIVKHSEILEFKRKVSQKLFFLKSNDETQFRLLLEKFAKIKLKAKELGIEGFALKPQKSFTLLLKIVASLVLFPVYLFGLAGNILPYLISTVYVKKTVNDVQFHSSFRLGIGFVVCPIYWILAGFLCYRFSSDILFSCLITVLLPFAGLFAFHYFKHIERLFQRVKSWYFKTRNHLGIIELIRQTDEIRDLVQVN